MTTFLSDADLTRLQTEHPEITGPCVTCKGKQVYLWRGEEHECDCQQQRRLYLRYLQAGIDKKLARLSWDDLAWEVPAPVVDYLDHAEAYVDEGAGLLFWGPLGTGKTLMATMVLKELIAKFGYTCYFSPFSTMQESFTATWYDNDEKARFAQCYMSTQVLTLDDLGKEKNFANLPRTTFDMILRTRANAARPTILTTNLSPDELKWGYGAAVLSLLVEQSIEVPVSAIDYRPISHDKMKARVAAGETRPIQ